MEKHAGTFCQNSTSYHRKAPLSKDLPYEPFVSNETATAEVVATTERPRGPSKSPGLDSKPQSRRRVKGEEPCDEMRRKGLGEEPELAFSASEKFAGQKLSDIYVLEIVAGTARLTKSLKQKGFKALAFDRTTNRSEGQTIFETDLSNKDEVEALFGFHTSESFPDSFQPFRTSMRHSEPSEGKEAEISPVTEHQRTNAAEK